MKKELWVVGGFVRDCLLGLRPSDLDFAIEAESYEDMKEWLQATYFNFQVKLEKPEYGRLIGGISSEYLGWTKQQYLSSKLGCKVPETVYADFVMCRADGDYYDGRHPVGVTPCSLETDLSRRDFTVNAIAIKDADGEVVDPFNGLYSLHRRELVTVGNPNARLLEDALRVLRYYRFQITKDLSGTEVVDEAIARNCLQIKNLLKENLFHDRIREELLKMLRHDTLDTINLLTKQFDPSILNVIFRENKLRLEPTYKNAKGGE